MEVHFNVEAIEYIKLYPSKLDNDYLWFDEETKQIKKFFGFIKLTKVYPAGWYELFMYHDREILSDSKDKLTSPHINYFVKGVNLYRKPQIEITLRNRHNLNYKFETDEESINYVDELKKKCKNKFEIIRYE